MRFDRRKTFPEASVDSEIEVLKAIIPERIGGVIKSRGPANVSVNRIMGRISHPYGWMLPTRRMNHGGVSEQFGSDYIGGITLQDNERVTYRYKFEETSGQLSSVNSTFNFIPGGGVEITAAGVGNFGFTIDNFIVDEKSRIVAIVKKLNGTFINWEGVSPIGVVNMNPGIAEVGKKEAIVSIDLIPSGTGTYGINGISSVSIGDTFNIDALAIITRVPLASSRTKSKLII